MKSSAFRFLFLVPALAVSLTVVTHAQVGPQPLSIPVTFNEISDSLLTASVGTVIQNGLDSWTWLAPTLAGHGGQNYKLVPGNSAWIEPGDPNSLNVAGGTLAIDNAFTWTSDVPKNPNGLYYLLNNGDTETSLFGIGYTDGTQEFFDVTFIDRGDVAPVPESAPTAGLLLLALGGIVGCSQWRKRTVLAGEQS